jgi:hypothetical protein
VQHCDLKPTGEMRAGYTGTVCERCNRQYYVADLDVKVPCVEVRHKRAVAASLDCIHRGKEVRRVECATCAGGKTKIKVFSCAIHGECALARVDGVRGCSGCRDRQAAASGSQESAIGPRKWFVAMTTAPRRVPTLGRTIASLAAAGWGYPLVFAEPGIDAGDIPERCYWRENEEKLGGWRNFINAVRGALEAAEASGTDDGEAALLIVQDDVVFARNVRPYLESIPWPTDAAALSIYCPKTYRQKARGFHRAKTRHLISALTFILTPAKARLLLGSTFAASSRNAGVDTQFGKWAVSHGGVYFHSPSLAQHVGDSSTLHPGTGNRGHRRAADFIGEDAEAKSLAVT